MYWIKDSLDSIILYKFRSFTQMTSYNPIITLFPLTSLLSHHPSFSLLVIASLFSIFVSLFLLCFSHQCVVFFIFHTHMNLICLSLIYFSFQIILLGHPYFYKWQIWLFFMAEYSIVYTHTHTHTHTHTPHSFFTSLSSYLLMGTQFASIFWQLKIMLLSILGCICLFKLVFFFFQFMNLWVELLGHR